MDGNKDEAMKCMGIGQKAFRDGDNIRAFRFLNKASRLDPTLPVENLLLSLSKGVGETAHEGEAKVEKESEVVKRRATESSGSDARTNAQHQAKAASGYYTEQAGIVCRIKRTKDYYQILGLNKDCSAEEIRKAYRKISLKVHPDKNKAPGAEEAFKAVSKAFACLSDEELKKKYDQYGPEESNGICQQRHARHYHSNGFREEMFDADEIFNSFFFGAPYPNAGVQRSRVFRTRGGVRTHEVQHSGGLGNVFQLLPILVLFLIALFSYSRPLYSLDEGGSYRFQQFTGENAVPFFVRTQDFNKDYPPGSPSRSNVEIQIERDYREVLHYNCHVELRRRYWNPSAKTPNCDMLKQLSVY
eukprot:c27427_g1_i1 orf=525-1598(-)